MKKAKDLPEQLGIIPILEAVLEVRFATDFPNDTVIGVVYKHFKDSFKNFEELPILALQPKERYEDTNLTYLPFCQMLSNDNKFALQVGQRVISIHCLHPHYDKWENFYNKVNHVLKEFNSLGISKEIEEVNLRYIDFFTEKNIPGYEFNKLNLSVKFGSLGMGDFFSCNSIFKMALADHNIQIFRGVDFALSGTSHNGDIIDIDSRLKDSKGISFEALAKKMVAAHNEQKEIFFDLIGEEVTKLLKPKG